MRRPPLQGPLLLQTYLGFWITGIATAVWPLPAACCALLLVLQPRLRMPLRLLAACGIFAAGLSIALHLLSPPQTPAWRESIAADNAKNPPERFCGKVTDVQGLPDDRLRVLLADLRPESLVGVEAEPAPGLTAWTWENPLFRPLPGQSLCLSARLRDTAGFAGMGAANWELYWTVRNVYQRLWSRGVQGNPQCTGNPSLSARLREHLRQALEKALQLPSMQAAHTQAQQAASSGLHAVRPQDRPSAPEAQVPPPQGKAVLMALLFGDRQYLDGRTLDNFAAAALVHSLALSGQHLAVAGLLGLLCILAAARLHAGLYLRLPRTLLITAASCPPALFYLWLGNAPASLLRAVCMLFIIAFWLLRGRARTTLDALCAAVFCITLVAPLSVFDTGLQLSALCVAVIGLSMPWLRRIMPDKPHAEGCASVLHRLVRALLRILAVSLIIQTALLPLNLLLFGNAGLWFPLNVLWLPVVDLFVLPSAALGLALAAADFEPAARMVLDAAALPCDALIGLLAFLAEHDLLQIPAMLRPHWTALPAFLLLLAAWGYTAGRFPLPRQSIVLAALGAALLCVGPVLRSIDGFSNETRLEIMDVGQGTAQALRTPGPVRLVLDGGGSTSSRFDPGRDLMAPALSTSTAPRLAAVLSSHPDLDHQAGLVHLLQRFQVAALFDNGRDDDGRRGAQWAALRQALKGRALAEGDVLLLGDPAQGLRLEVLHPPRSAEALALSDDIAGHDAKAGREWAGNDASLVLRLSRHGQGLALFTGDLELPGQQRLVHSGRDLRAEVLIAPHHGSDRNFSAAFYKAVAPRLVVASCGRQNRYNYPGRRLRAWLEEQGITLLRTDRDGRISVRWPAGAAAGRVTTARSP